MTPSTPGMNIAKKKGRLSDFAARTGDPDKLQRAQGGGRLDLAQSATVQEKADRVLSRIRQKLRDDLSVEYRVNQLIQEATDVENLAKIFVGEWPDKYGSELIKYDTKRLAVLVLISQVGSCG